MDKNELRRIAATHGLSKLADAHLDHFAAGIRANAEVSAGLPKDLHWTEEPAHVFRLPQADPKLKQNGTPEGGR